MYQRGHIFITRTGFQNLKSKLEELNEEQVKLGQDLHEAHEPGRLSENGSYSAALERKIEIEEYIQEINATLKRSKLINKPKRRSIAGLGSTVKLKSENDILEYTIVDSLEADPSRGYISYKSPAGQDILGHRVGDQVEIGNGEKVQYTVLSID